MAIRKGGTVSMRGMARVISNIPKFRLVAKQEAQRVIEREKKAFISEFTNHKVTREIEDGVSAENISNTLGGAGSNSNLFTFIGFEGALNPVRPVRTILENSIFISSATPRVRGGATRFPVMSIGVQLPDNSELKDVTQMPWQPGRSWLFDIEEGISGFGYYMFKKFEAGRSKYGLQSEHKVRSSSYRPVPYFKFMYDRFINRLRKM